MKKILFISHDASRTGAPLLLLNFLRWFKENTDIPFEIILGRGGELRPNFEALAPTMVFFKDDHQHITIRRNNFIRRIWRRVGIGDPTARNRRKLAGANIGLIYSNTSTNGLILQELASLNCPLISHIHELNYNLDFFSDKLDLVRQRTAHYISASQAVKDNLISRLHISPDDVSVIYGFTPLASAQKDSAAVPQQLLRRELNLTDDAFITGAAGGLNWCKSPDLFVRLAGRVRGKINAPIHFVWIGSGDKEQAYKIDYDISRAGLKDRVHFLGSKSNLCDYLSDFDLISLTSREDSFPTICLEAASLGKPTLCFDKAGGEPEFVEKDCGFVVPYLDVDAMADRIIELYKDRELLRKLGQNAAQKARRRHKLEDAAPRILEVIERYLGNGIKT